MRWTDEVIEDWLIQEQRLVRGPGNRVIELVQSVLFWEQFDYLRDRCFTSEEEIILLGIQTQREFSFPFSLGVQDAVAHAYKHYFGKFGLGGCPTSYHRSRRMVFNVPPHHLGGRSFLAKTFSVAALGDCSGIY